MTHLLRLLFAVTVGVASAIIATAVLAWDMLPPMLTASCSAYLAIALMLLSLKPALGGRLFSTITAEKLIDIMNKCRLDAGRWLAGDEMVIKWKIGGGRVVDVEISESRDKILFRLRNDQNCGDFEAAPKLNMWLIDSTCARSFINETGYATLEMELSLKGGVSAENVSIHLAKFLRLARKWLEVANCSAT
jgi:hypothetical protein